MYFVFSLTIFLSALLLFLVQPMVGKMILPLLGGASSVWITAIMFFQGMLLAGYLYAYFSAKYLTFKMQPFVQIAVMGLAIIYLPIGFADDMAAPTSGNPAIWLSGKLLLYVGLPFFALAANSPMLQHWFANTNHKLSDNPYFLYAASNVGSMLALLSYPFWVERSFDLSKQSELWTSLYFVLVATIVLCAAATLARFEPVETTISSEDDKKITLKRRLHWIFLAFVPSVMLLAATSYITTDIAPLPLFWVLPLALYLLTFTIVFSRKPIISLEQSNKAHFIVLLIFVVGGGLYFSQPGFVYPLKYYFTSWSFLILHLCLLFFTALLLHGKLAKDRPHPSKLTEFYLWMSVGGFLGGVFSSLLSPVIFNDYYEYPLAICLACFARIYEKSSKKIEIDDLSMLIPFACCLIALPNIKSFMLERFDYLFIIFNKGGFIKFVTIVLVFVMFIKAYKRPVLLSLLVAALILTPLVNELRFKNKEDKGKSYTMLKERSFFGVLKVDKSSKGHTLINGTTRHGFQRSEDDRRLEPTLYFSKNGPAGAFMDATKHVLNNHPVALLGLGVGTMACYGQKEQQFDFYEINPAVKKIATNPEYFTFMRDCSPNKKVIIGDGRLAIGSAPDNYYGLIVADAFSSDSIPTHLLTMEAIKLYLKKLRSDGFIALHISNKYLNLEKPLGRVAKELDLTALVAGYGGSTWIIMTEDKKTFASIKIAEEKKEEVEKEKDNEDKKSKKYKKNKNWKVLKDYPDMRLWTDKYTDLGSIIKF